MNYVHNFPKAYIRYYASDTILHIDINAAYLVDPKACSIVTGCFHISDHLAIIEHPKLNGEILV